MSRKPIHQTYEAIQKIKGVLNGTAHWHSADPAKTEWILNLCSWELIAPCGSIISLTHNEFRFLKILSKNISHPVCRHEIMTELFNRSDMYTNRSLDSLVRRLRLKIQASSASFIPIKTAHSIGYAFSAPLIIR